MAATKHATPAAIVTGSRKSSSNPAAAASTRGIGPVFPTPSTHAPAAAESAKMPAHATAVAHSTSSAGPRPSRYSPASVTTNAIGTRNAGNAYFRVCHIVGITRPPVIADAPTAASAVGGVTSDSTE